MKKCFIILGIFYCVFLYPNIFAQITICPGSNAVINTDINGLNYKWQVDSGQGFGNLMPSTYFTGISTAALQIAAPPGSWYSYQFRCVVDQEFSSIKKLSFSNTWAGSVSNDFLNPQNWSCRVLPDMYTDVIIASGTPELNTSKSVKSITLRNAGNFRVSNGAVLQIFGKEIITLDNNFTKEDIDFFDTIDAPLPPLRVAQRVTDQINLRPKELVIKTMMDFARELCALKSVEYISDTGRANFPLRYFGLAYSYGSRNHLPTLVPRAGDALHRHYPVKGLDCSGMMIELLRAAGIMMDTNTSTQTFENAFRTVLNNNISFPTLKIINLDSVPDSDLYDGDFMLWLRKGHVGVIKEVENYKKVLYQSNGQPYPLTNQGITGGVTRTSYEEQRANWGISRGSTVKKFTDAIKTKGYWGTDYSILRLAEVFDMNNTSVFSTSNFSSVAVGKGGYIYAGTSNLGMYVFNGNSWQKLGTLLNNNIYHIQKDKSGGIWIAQGGSSGAQAINGGVNFITDTGAKTVQYFPPSNGLPSRLCRSLFIDTTRFQSGSNARVWTANLSDILISGSGNSGAVGLGLNATSPFFAKITSGVDPAGGLGSVQCIGGNSNEIWAYAAVNYGRSQILRYNAGAQGLITTIGTYDNLNTPALTSNFSVRGIYFDPSDNRWIGMATGGMVVKVGSSWHTINYPNIFPAGTAVNINAVTGNKQGKVFIGTTNGLVIYNGIGPVTDSKAFTRLTSLEGLPNTNVRSVCYDEENKRLVLATFGGIMIIKY